jgi:hypothetical protein
MSVFKDEKTNKWYAMVRFTDWQGQRKQKCKRGFATRRDALEWEKVFQMQTTSDLDMSFEAWSFEHRSGLFEEVIGIRPELRTRRTL